MAAPLAQAVTWQAIGVGSARAHELDRAVQSERALSSLREKLLNNRDVYWADQAEVQRREVAAWIKDALGDAAGALATMRSAAELEEAWRKTW